MAVRVISSDGRVIVEAYFKLFGVVEAVGAVGIVKLVRVVGMIMVVIEASDRM